MLKQINDKLEKMELDITDIKEANIASDLTLGLLKDHVFNGITDKINRIDKMVAVNYALIGIIVIAAQMVVTWLTK